MLSSSFTSNFFLVGEILLLGSVSVCEFRSILDYKRDSQCVSDQDETVS